MKSKFTISKTFWHLILVIWGLSIILPLFWIGYESLKTNIEFFGDAWKLPTTLQWRNYQNALSKLGIGSAMLNTLYVVGVSMVVSLFVLILNAYAFSRMEWKFRKVIWFLFMLALFLPGINVLVPDYVILRTLHLTNSTTGLIAFYIIGINVVNLMILKSFMGSIPKEMVESAVMDGASIMKTIQAIIVPLSMPGIVTVAIFMFIGYYNDFLMPLISLSDPVNYTIGVAMYQGNMMMQYRADWVTLLAGMVITIAPCIILYLIFQKRIVEGASLGAIKG